MTKNINSLNKQNLLQTNFQNIFLNDKPENLYQHELHFTHSSSEDNKEKSSILSNLSNSKSSENPNKNENEEEDEIIESDEDDEMAKNINNIHNLIENNTIKKENQIAPEISPENKKKDEIIDKNSSSYLSKSHESKKNEENNSKKSKKNINEEKIEDKKTEEKNSEEQKEEEEKTLSNIKNIEKKFSISSKNSSIYILNNQTKIFNHLELLKNKPNCTYFKFGNYNINQPVFFCENCDPNKTERICFNCFNTCHNQCHSISMNKNDESNNLNNNFIHVENDKIKKNVYLTFICTCGQKKHILNEKTELISNTKCIFIELDRKLHNKAIYSCLTCNLKNLCYICYLNCHSTCDTQKQFTNDKKKLYNSCLCNNNFNHSNRMLLNKFINNIFNSEKSNYDTISFVWKCQILNSVFDGTIYKLLYEKVCNFLLSSYHFQNEIFEGKSINDTTIDTLTRIVINLNKTKKFYYLHENLVKMAPLSNITILLNSFLDKHLVKYSTFINDLLSFFLIIHLKKDFQNVKILNYRDYLITNPIERILFRKTLGIKSIYNYDLLKKYTNDDNFILSQILLDFLNLALRALKKYEINDYDKFLNNYLIVFEILYFVIKIINFEIKKYIKFIEVLELFFNEFYKGFQILLKNYDKKIFEQIKKLINYISKIVFIIIVNFNDKILEKYLNLNKDDYNNNEIEFEENDKYSQFIHYISNHSKSLFKILISSSIIYNTHILNQNFGPKNLLKNNKIIDMIIFVNHCLELFTLTDNVYFKCLDKIKIIDFLYYEIFLNKLLNREKIEEKIKFN